MVRILPDVEAGKLLIACVQTAILVGVERHPAFEVGARTGAVADNRDLIALGDFAITVPVEGQNAVVAADPPRELPDAVIVPSTKGEIAVVVRGAPAAPPDGKLLHRVVDASLSVSAIASGPRTALRKKAVPSRAPEPA